MLSKGRLPRKLWTVLKTSVLVTAALEPGTFFLPPAPALTTGTRSFHR